MEKRGWIGALALLASLGCGGNASEETQDGSAGGQDGAPDGAGGREDASPSTEASSSDAPGSSDTGIAEAGATDAGCVTGSVSFELHAGPGAPSFCLGAPGSCSAEWLAIRPAADGGTYFGLEMPCEPSCTDCQPVACNNLCRSADRLGDGGARTTWDGTYLASSTCGAATACIRDACAPAGDYIARFCGYAEIAEPSTVSCTGSPTSTCTEVPFLWPPPAGSGPVQGVIGGAAQDAGSCCPTGWGLSSCTYPDGGTGQQCHNPAMGCASSATCGSGCDAIVTGRCDAG